VEKLRERILSNEPTSPIIAKCIELSKRVEVNQDYVLWLKNELYGYDDYIKANPNLSEPGDFPNNPDYRKLRGELRAGFIRLVRAKSAARIASIEFISCLKFRCVQSTQQSG
jgi:hypothetical protein